MAERNVSIVEGAVTIAGDLDTPDDAKGVVVFAHGSGSSRKSPRNRSVAQALRDAGFATLLFDLLTVEEDRAHATRFDIELLTRRLTAAIHWVRSEPMLAHLPLGLFGASTGAAAALKAAASLPSSVAAVVSRGGRPDLAGIDLAHVVAPTLLIVGGHDRDVLDLNRQAADAMPPETARTVEIVPGATHLFEEPGALEAVCRSARVWFERYLLATGAGTQTCRVR